MIADIATGTRRQDQGAGGDDVMTERTTEAAANAGVRTVPADQRAVAVAARYPAHDGAARLYGDSISQDAEVLYRRLRAEYGSVAPVLLEGDIPAWLVLGLATLPVTFTPA
jgi:hypothetical protein